METVQPLPDVIPHDVKILKLRRQREAVFTLVTRGRFLDVGVKI